MDEVRQVQQVLESELPLLRNRLKTTKESLSDLNISDTLYHKLKQQPGIYSY